MSAVWELKKKDWSTTLSNVPRVDVAVDEVEGHRRRDVERTSLRKFRRRLEHLGDVGLPDWHRRSAGHSRTHDPDVVDGAEAVEPGFYFESGIEKWSDWINSGLSTTKKDPMLF